MTAIDIRDLHEMHDDGDMGVLLGWMAKGHHDPDAFRAALRDHEEAIEEIEYEGWSVEKVTALDVRQDHWRNVPLGNDPITAGGMRFVPSKPGPGAYPVTVLDLPWPPRRRKELLGSEVKVKTS